MEAMRLPPCSSRRCRGSAAAQDAKTVIANASKAMGADTLNTIEYSGIGVDFALGQALNPNAPWPKFIDKTYTRAIDFETPARGWTASGCRARTRRAAAASSRPRRAAAEPDHHRQREHAVGAAARNLDDAARLPEGGRRQQRDRGAADGRRQEVQRPDLHRRRTRRRSTATSTIRTWSSASRPGSTTRARRHAVRGDLHRLQGLRRREVPDADRAAAGWLSDPRPDGHRREAERAGEHSGPQGRGGAPARRPRRGRQAAAHRRRSSPMAST